MAEKKTKKQSILEVAALLFHEQGYKASSMRVLAKRVGFGQPSSLYSHYDSKEEILRAICFRNARLFVSGMETIQKSERTTLEKIQALIALHIDIATEDVTSVIVFNDEWRHLIEPHLSAFRDLRKEYETGFYNILKEGVAEGVLRPLDTQTMLYTMLAALRWLHYQPKSVVNSDQTDQLKKEMTDLLLGGVRLG